jgi:hypothetical protein
MPSARGQEAPPEGSAFRNDWIEGQVVYLAEALEKEFGISTVPEVAQHGLAIVAKDGRLYPLVENLRGRAFRKDERLRGIELQFLVRRHDRQPLVQVLRICQREGGQQYEIDYWCDVCAIVMYETGPCACCQDDNRLRKRLIEPGEEQGEKQSDGTLPGDSP